ncbi:MAG: asparagine synthase (glutamine-hydrolyzing) [Nitrospirae bacterium]|nr:MAG: asparagine synthase (glutamine-hydrolyzing) [Nitrospirota bacterium]
MCGIVGWLGRGIDPELALRMRDSLYHRGPDDSGYWHDTEANVWLGHRRLAILDLSEAGHQPMLSHSGRYVIVFNGELYNYKELGGELQGLGERFLGHSDTEVMLAAIERWGLKQALARFIGMFAFALWDRQEQSLTLVRDRLGIKPLYYADAEGQFAFSSELRALARLPWLDSSIDQEALADYLRFLCVPAPRSILRGARKLAPGTLLIWRDGEVRNECYWDLKEVALQGLANPLEMDFCEAADELEARLRDAIALRMRSDVPYGAFLSGGVDSSVVAALMQQLSPEPVHTFTVGFPNTSHDESRHARAVATHLGTRHHEAILESRDVVNLIGEVAAIHDEPFADGSSVPTYLLSRFVRNHVTVALSGDGGDELFGGYPRYYWATRIERWRRRLGPIGSRLAASALRHIPDWLVDGPVTRAVAKGYRGADGLGARVRRLGGYLGADAGNVDLEMTAAWVDPVSVMQVEPKSKNDRYAMRLPLDWPEQMMAMDQMNYLPNDILTKVDRASMAVSLEVRVPLLDHRLVEWSWRVPRQYKFNESGDRGKLLLREVLYRHMPKTLIERPKMGFGMPMAQWLRGPLRAWAEDWLAESALVSLGLLKTKVVRLVWQEHLAGKNRLPQIWTVLMLQIWFANWRQAIR